MLARFVHVSRRSHTRRVDGPHSVRHPLMRIWLVSAFWLRVMPPGTERLCCFPFPPGVCAVFGFSASLAARVAVCGFNFSHPGGCAVAAPGGFVLRLPKG